MNPDQRAREIEEQLTDDERFALIVSVMGRSDFMPERDARIPEDAAMSAGYTPGVPRLGVPALQMCLGTEWGTATTIEYQEGAEVGYRWFAQTGEAPLYAFGHGLSYTAFEYADLALEGVTATFTVTNTGDCAGADVAQLYLTAPRTRLLGFERVELAPGESKRVTITAEPKVLAFFDRGVHYVAVARAADAPVLTRRVEL